MIVLKNIEKSLGAFTLSIERLEVQPGEYLVLLGPSGAGKTVLLLNIAGLILPDAGEILFNGASVTRFPPERRDVGLVFQEANLFPHLSVAENIAFGKRYRRKRAADIQERMELLVDMLRIRHLLGRNVEGLSGGEKQRAAVARALAVGPTVLLMDEPLGLLDQNTREELRGELRRVHDELGTTTLHVTHDRNEAFAMGDRIAILNEGRLAQIGSRDEITAEPASEFVARFIGAENIFEAHAEQDATGRTFVRIGERRFPVACQHEGAVLVCVRPDAVSLRSKPPGRASLQPSIPGTVASVEERGLTVRVVVKCDMGDVIVLCGREQFLHTGLSCLSSTWLEIDPAAVHVIPTAQ